MIFIVGLSVLTNIVEHSLAFTSLTTDQTLDDLDQPQLEPGSSLDESNGLSFSFSITSPNVVLWQLDSIGIALCLTGVCLGHGIVTRS